MSEKPKTFRQIYEAELGYVYTSLRRLGVKVRHLEDLTHDVFLVVHRKLDDYDSSRPLRPWLFGIAYRVALDHKRKFAGTGAGRHADGEPLYAVLPAPAHTNGSLDFASIVASASRCASGTPTARWWRAA